MDHASRARRRHAEQYLRRLQQIERKSPGPNEWSREQQEAFDRIWPQVRHAAQWVIAQAGGDADADMLCAEYPTAASAYWYFRVSSHERVTILQAALAAARRLRWAREVASLNSALGTAYLDAGYSSKAVARFLDGEGLHKDTPDEAYDLGLLALAYLELDWPERAVYHLDRALALCRVENDHFGAALMLERLARAYRELNQPDRSDEFARESAAIVAEHDRGHHWILDANGRYFRAEGQLHYLHDRALACLADGRPADAISELQDAVSLARSTGDISAELDMLRIWVTAALDLGDHQQALEYAEKQVQRSGAAPWDKQWEAFCRLGDIYRTAGRPDRALESHQQALRLLAEQTRPDDDGRYDLPGMMVDDEDGFGVFLTAVNARRRTLAAIAADHETLGDHATAIAYYIRALQEFGTQQGGPWDAWLIGQLALAYEAAGLYAHAMANRRAQLQIYRKIQDRAGVAGAVAEMGNVRMAQDLYSQALELYQAAALIVPQVVSTRNQARLLMNLAHAELHLGRLLHAAHYADQALPLARSQRDAATVSFLEQITAHVQAQQSAAASPAAADGTPPSQPVVLRAFDQAASVCDAFTTQPVSNHVRDAARVALRLGDLAAAVADPGRARAAWLAAAASGDLVTAPIAAGKLARLLAADGPSDDEAAWAIVMDAGDRNVAAEAAYVLGMLRANRGALMSARLALEKAVLLGGDKMRHAAFGLGIVLDQVGDELGARDAYRHAAGCSDPETRARASFRLAATLLRQGDMPGALQAFGQARTARHPEIAAAAMLGIGEINTQLGNLTDAALALGEAITTGDPYTAPTAAGSLGVVRMRQGDPDAAKAAFELALSSPNPEVVAFSAANLSILADGLDPDHAERLLASIAPIGDLDADSVIAFRLAAIRLRRGDQTSAAQAWLRTTDNNPQAAAEAAIGFAERLAEQGALGEADEALTQALLFNVPQAQISAISARVRLLADHGRAEQALSVLNEAIDHGGHEVSAAAAILLAGLHAGQNDNAAATAALERAAASGHPRYAAQALYNLGVHQQEVGNLTRARDLYEQVLSSGTELAPFAANNLCAVCMTMGDLDAAEAALRPALDSYDTEQAAKAWVNLGVLRWHHGDRDGARAAWHHAAAVNINVAAEVRRLRADLET
jgi:tetratricopeptide (TPR) repeat protein